MVYLYTYVCFELMYVEIFEKVKKYKNKLGCTKKKPFGL